MKRLLMVLSLLFAPVSLMAVDRYEIDIHGMTCAFCVYGLERSLKKLPDIDDVRVSLKHMKVQIGVRAPEADLDAIRQAVIDAGFTPVRIEQLPDAQ